MQKEELIRIGREIVENENIQWLSAKQFTSKTGISTQKALKHYDKWNDFVQSLGLYPLDKKGRPDQTKGYCEQELIYKIKLAAEKLKKKSLTLLEFYEITGISERPIYRIFGNWNDALSKAGLERDYNYKVKISDEDLFKEYLKLYTELGRLPLYKDIVNSKYSRGTYEKRFGNFNEFKKRAILYGISAEILKPEITDTIDLHEEIIKAENKKIYKKLDDRPVLGERIDFRGLRHAPVNELGVVFLFGSIANELGFEVESVQAGFPDCLAKRKLKKEKWQNVKIEFEFKASNFLLHKHNQNECDMIICWENDWRNSPIEVISLKDVLVELKQKG